MTRPTWTESPDAATTFARYCAPTVLAALMDCPPREAAELLLDAKVTHPVTPGAVDSSAWHQWLRSEFGGVALSGTRPDGVERWNAAWYRFDERLDEYYEGRRYDPPREPSWVAAHRYTVAQFLRLHPQGTIVISIGAHTLLARDGEVVADAMSTKSSRGRVKRATLIPGATRT